MQKIIIKWKFWMKSRKPEIKWGKADYPDYGIKFELIKPDTKEYIFI